MHYSNRTGVRASCPDCHVLDPRIHRFVGETQTTDELWHQFHGSIDPPAKFEAERMQLARNV